jgi:hypothetical protein
MAYSYNDFASKSPGETITVGFPFQSRDHVKVLVEDVEVSETLWSWVTDGSIECLAGFPAGAGRVQRITPDDELEGTLVGTASFDYPMVNRNFERTLFILQEKADAEADREARTVAIETELETQQSSLNASVALGQKWATEAEDVVVASGQYSAKHHALKGAASASAASSSAGSAAGSATAAAGYATTAQKWASEAEDVEVSGGLFSALHYAAKAAASLAGVIAGMAGAIHGATAKATPADADEFGFADSEDGWGLKKLTWANIKSTLKTYFDTLYVPVARSVATQHSLTGGGTLSTNRTFSLVNDAASPGNYKVYGTGVGGTRGWFDAGLGIGQTWQNVLASRAHSTTYQNTTGKPIAASIGSTSTFRFVQTSEDGTTWLDVAAIGGSSSARPVVPIPNGHYYRVNGSLTIDYWNELR